MGFDPTAELPSGYSKGAAANLIKYGIGLPHSPIVVYQVTPQIAGLEDVLKISDVGVDTQGFVPMNVPGTVGLSNFSTPYWGSPFTPVGIGGETAGNTAVQSNAQGSLAIQFQYPTILNVSITQTAETEVCIFGYDFYYQPMQENITVPASVAGESKQGNKAFYGVTGVYLPAAWVEDATDLTISPYVNISGANSNMTFGLPFVLYDESSTLNYAETDFPSTTSMDVVEADLSVATSTTGDVRGIFTTQGLLTAIPNYWSGILTYFVQGAQPLLSAIAQDQLVDNKDHFYQVDNNKHQVIAPTSTLIYGPAQYYKGYYTA